MTRFKDCSIKFRSKHYCITSVFTTKFNGTDVNCKFEAQGRDFDTFVTL